MASDALVLRPLRLDDEDAFRRAHAAMADEGFTFGLWFDDDTSFPDYVRLWERRRQGLDLEGRMVPSTFLVADVGGVIVGRASIRHELNEFLLEEGGHIGYGVLREHRRRGHGTEILRRALDVTDGLGIERVLVTCDDDNVGSATIIERCGGVFDSYTTGESGAPLRRYWIDRPGAAPVTAAPGERLRALLDGYRVTQVISVAVSLGLTDRLGDSRRTAADLAEAVGADPDTLGRLLRALASLGLLDEQPGAGPGEPAYALTDVGRLLRVDAAGSLAGWAAFVTRPYHWSAWGDLAHSVRTGETAFDARHGESVWDWRARDPEEGRVFDRAMATIAAAVSARLVERYDFGRFATVADVGGGDGTLLAAVLARHPGLRGVLLDLPHVVAGAPATLGAAGVADRCRVVAGSFFDEVPPGCDAYVMKSILHDWDDATAATVLGRVRSGAGPGTTLVVVERVLADEAPTPSATLSDLNMLVMTGGRERTLAEWRTLAAAGGFAVTTTTDLGLGWRAVEAVPA
jgi:predicted acetyltransferase